jgi:phospholipid/cholesterol/gamma-HCH transport system substrate-binding protein
MDNRKMQFRVGVVVSATAILAGLLAALNSPMPGGLIPWGRGTYRIAIRLNEAPGVGEDTPVRKSGVLIGRVASIEDFDDHVVVWANIEEGRRLFGEYECQVRTSVLGDARIEFVTRPLPQGAQPLTEGATVEGTVVGNPLDVIANLQDDLATTIASLGRAGDEVADLAQRVNEAIGDETQEGRITRLMAKTELAMDQFGQAAGAFNEILGGQTPEDIERRRQMREGLAELHLLIGDARTMIRSADRNLTNLEGFTKPLGENGPQIANSIVEAVDGLDKLVEEFTILTEALNSREGTLGQLIHNPQLYENGNRLIINANTVIAQLHELLQRLRPVADDLRVFSDKIAREPGRLGTGIVPGAVNPPSPVK